MKKRFSILLALLAIASFAMGQCGDMPLRIAFLDAPNILNDGTENTLTIGIYNTNDPSLSSRGGNFTFQKGAPFHIWFNTNILETDTEPWGLTTKNLLFASSVKVEVAHSRPNAQRVWNRSNDDDGTKAGASGFYDQLGYALTPAEDVTLQPGDHLTVTISGLKSTLPSGPTDAIFHYESPDTNQYCPFDVTIGTIQKSPLFVTQQKVGIATNQTNAAAFNIKGGMRVEGGELKPGADNNTGYSFNNGDGSTGIASRKDGQVGVYANGLEVASFESEKGSPSVAVNGELWVKETYFPPAPNTIYYIQAENGMVWDVYNFSKDPGGTINLANNAFGNNQQQQWKLIPDNNGYYRIQNVNSGLFAVPSNEGITQQNKDNTASQLFMLISVGDGSFYLESKQSTGMVLTIGNTTSFGGTIPMPLQANRNLPSQVFRFIEPGQSGFSLAKLGSAGKYQIVEKLNNLDINAESGTSIAFTNGDSKNFSIESNTGNIAAKGDANIGGGANIGGQWRISKIGNDLVISNTQTNANAMTIQPDGMIRFAKPLSVTGTIDFPAGAASGSVRVEVPYGTTDDWTFWISHMSRNEWNTGPTPWDSNTGIKNSNYLENIRYWTDTSSDKKHFTATINTYYAQDTPSNINYNRIPYCCLKYIMVRK